MHTYMDVTLHWNPNAAEEVARRRAEGLPVGGESRKRSLVTKDGTLADLRLNWDGTKAITTNYEFVSSKAGLLTCKNCYAFLAAQYSFTLQFCLYGYFAGSYYWWTSDDFTGCIGSTGGICKANPASTSCAL